MQQWRCGRLFMHPLSSVTSETPFLRWEQCYMVQSLQIICWSCVMKLPKAMPFAPIGILLLLLVFNGTTQFAHGASSRAGPADGTAHLWAAMSRRHQHSLASGAQSTFATKSGSAAALGTARMSRPG